MTNLHAYPQARSSPGRSGPARMDLARRLWLLLRRLARL